MKILVCMKQVPQKDAPLKLDESGAWIREDVSYEVNEPDAYALEEALRQKEKHGGEVVVITSGPPRAQQVLREALAKGADRAIHLEDNAFVGLDAFNTARAFAAAIKDETFDLIFTGLQSDDYGYAQTGVVLAELLGWPHAGHGHAGAPAVSGRERNGQPAGRRVAQHRAGEHDIGHVAHAFVRGLRRQDVRRRAGDHSPGLIEV